MYLELDAFALLLSVMQVSEHDASLGKESHNIPTEENIPFLLTSIMGNVALWAHVSRQESAQDKC